MEHRLEVGRRSSETDPTCTFVAWSISAAVIQKQLSDTWGSALLRTRQLLHVAETSGRPTEDLSSPPRRWTRRQCNCNIRGKVWRELDLTLKNRVLETGFRAAGENSPNRSEERRARIKQEMTSDSPLSSDRRERTCDGAGNPGKNML